MFCKFCARDPPHAWIPPWLPSFHSCVFGHRSSRVESRLRCKLFRSFVCTSFCDLFLHVGIHHSVFCTSWGFTFCILTALDLASWTGEKTAHYLAQSNCSLNVCVGVSKPTWATTDNIKCNASMKQKQWIAKTPSVSFCLSVVERRNQGVALLIQFFRLIGAHINPNKFSVATQKHKRSWIWMKNFAPN